MNRPSRRQLRVTQRRANLIKRLRVFGRPTWLAERQGLLEKEGAEIAQIREPLTCWIVLRDGGNCGRRPFETRPVHCAHARAKPPLHPPRAPLWAHRPEPLNSARRRCPISGTARRSCVSTGSRSTQRIARGSTTRRHTCRRSESARSCAHSDSARSSHRTIRTMRSARPCRDSSAGRSTRSRRTRCLCFPSTSLRAFRRAPTSALSG